MKNFFRNLLINKRPIFYSLILSIGFCVLIFILEYNPEKNYFLGSVVLYIILMFEIYATWAMGRKKLKQLEVPILDQYSQLTQVIMHYSLPSLAYWAIVGFIYTNTSFSISILLIIIIFILFLTLFINIRAYYLDKFRIEEKTHYIYDVLKLFIYFLIIYTLYIFEYKYNINFYTPAFLIVLFSFIIQGLNLYRYNHIHLNSILFIFFNSLVLGIISILLNNIVQINLFEKITISFISYYFLMGITHHKIRKDLTVRIVLEYFLFGVLALLIFIGI